MLNPNAHLISDHQRSLALKAHEAVMESNRLAARALMLKAVVERFPDAVESHDRRAIYATSAREVADRVGFLHDPFRGDRGVIGLFFYALLETPAGEVRVYDPTPVPEDRIDAVLSSATVAHRPLFEAAQRLRGKLVRPGEPLTDGLATRVPMGSPEEATLREIGRDATTTSSVAP